MDIALVTGADAGPGLAIARRLIGMGCRVYALATQFSRNPFPHDDFITLAVNLADPEALSKVAEDIVARDGHINYVVHAARQSPAPLLDSPVSAFVERVNIGLLAPIALARVTLPWLRKEQGHFLVLAWNGDGPALGGPVAAAVEGGLHHFAEALFEELGSDGVKATTLYARPNKETPPEALMSLDPQSAINPELVADTVEQLFRSRPTNIVSTLTIRPVANAETPRLLRSSELAGLTTRDVQLPPRQNFPQEPEPISTPIRARPADAPFPVDEEFDEEDEEDDEFDPTAEPLPWAREDAQGGAPREGGEQQRPQGDRPPSQGDRPPQGGRGYDPDRGYGPQGGQGRGRGRRRGRGGRGRGRGDNYDNRPPQGGRGPQRPQGGGDNRSGPPSQDRGPDQGPARPDYPDPEEESERRALARDDSFRTPHSESDEDQHNGGGDDSAPRGDEGPGDYIPREDNSRGGDEPRDDDRGPRDDDRGPRDDDRGPRDDDREPQGERESRGDDYQPSRDRSDRAPGDNRDPRDENRGPRDENRGSREDDRGRSDDRGPRDDNREPVPAGERREYRGDDRRGDPRDQRDDRRPQGGGQQGNRPQQGGQGQGHGRRHRGFGRKPPPGGGRGPTRE